MSLLLLKKDRPVDPVILDAERLAHDEGFGRIRCPLCSWHPTASSLWCCDGSEAPEPFKGCGTLWNTFSTRGVCPGCSHQWQWTSCLRCHQWSPHEKWYERKDAPAG
jgi:hypothetical protein